MVPHLKSGWRAIAGSLGRSTSGETATSAMFGRIRWKLTLWYCAVLAAALLLCGVVVYIQTRNTVLDSVDSQLQQQASAGSELCIAGLGFVPPPAPPPDLSGGTGNARNNLLLACYDLKGRYRGPHQVTASIPHYVDSAPAMAVLESGAAATDIVNTGTGLGRIERREYRLIDALGRPVGVIQVGAQVGAQLDALEVLLRLLLVVGVLALGAAAVGGFFLANRALLPARLAHARQSEFIADASHELRTPLTMMRADAEVLLRGRDRLSADDAAILEDVVSEAAHMANLANSMLNLARLDAGAGQIEQEVLDLAHLAEGLVRRVGPLAMERNVEVRAAPLAPALVIGDRMLLEQAALILLDNAIKYNHAGGTVSVSTCVKGDGAMLEVRDTGIGISAEHLPRLGERFYRVDKARSREAGGAGLGVSIAQSIVARHDGSLRLTSEPGRGTCAVLLLPAARNVRQPGEVA